jgi:hypothetical protein
VLSANIVPGRGPTVMGLADHDLRTWAFSLAYSLATALFGGFTPAVATWLIHATGDRAIPGAWLSFGAILALGAAITFAEPTARKPPHS